MFNVLYFLLVVPASLIALVVHEVSHGYAAYKLGDPTAHVMGRLSLNPLKHLDPIGALCMVFFKFGWAKPVPIDARYFKNPKRDTAITAIAGPVSNLLLAFFAVPCFLLLENFYVFMAIRGTPDIVLTIISFFFNFFYVLHTVNIGLGLFNLIPIPPLDGSRILLTFLPTRYYFQVMRYERYIAFGLMILLFSGFRFGILDNIFDIISNALQWVWRLIPIFS